METNPQKPIKIIKEKDINEKDVEVPEKEILAAAKKLKKEKEKLMEKVPTRKEYKRKYETNYFCKSFFKRKK